jgi:hypothetical protein
MGSNDENEIIEVIQSGSEELKDWQPIIGPEVLSLMDNIKKVPDEEKKVIRDEAISILSRCDKPIISQNITGLAIGYVQSGKTMSFTAVTALAKDNKYCAVILITGTSVHLYNQSTTRLENDLRLNTRPDRAWLVFKNPKIQNGDHIAMKAALDDWQDPRVPDNARQAILITVMKNFNHLEDLIQVLANLNLKDVSVLVIDDEADQAGLNTLVQQGDQSTTYRQLLNLRNHLPHHKFLQYTATPQAPLLINIIDVLSPQFAEVLTPGSGYVGGKDFFIYNSHLVRTIPDNEIPPKTIRMTEPPDSLLEAMRIFFLGVAAGQFLTGGEGNRSMLVHPSQKTKKHKIYMQWVESVKQNWLQLIDLDPKDPDRVDLIDDFKKSYIDLKSTVPDLPSFEDLENLLPWAIRRTLVKEVNRRLGAKPPINWRASYSYILVGGQAMDRGFTVEGLTVTYMPREIGVANADTVQQRARFLGYKRSYLGYCRIYLERELKDAYRKYIDHEEDVRGKLLKYRGLKMPLAEWKRAFFLDRALKPTRNCVLDLDYTRGGYEDDWYEPKAPHYSKEASEENFIIIQSILRELKLRPDDGDPGRTANQRHSVNDAIPLNILFEKLLVKLRVAYPNDSQKYIGMLIQVGNYLEKNPEETACLYMMSYLEGKWIPREHKIHDNGEVGNLFQGAYPTFPKDKQGSIYPGDEKIRINNRLTVQIRNLRVTDNGKNVLAENCPAISVWVPAKMGGDWLVQGNS